MKGEDLGVGGDPAIWLYSQRGVASRFPLEAC